MLLPRPPHQSYSSSYLWTYAQVPAVATAPPPNQIPLHPPPRHQPYNPSYEKTYGSAHDTATTSIQNQTLLHSPPHHQPHTPPSAPTSYSTPHTTTSTNQSATPHRPAPGHSCSSFYGSTYERVQDARTATLGVDPRPRMAFETRKKVSWFQIEVWSKTWGRSRRGRLLGWGVFGFLRARGRSRALGLWG